MLYGRPSWPTLGSHNDPNLNEICMKRATHLMLGAAVAMPIAVPLSPGLALGAIWWGMVGGGFPDWFDLRSDLRKPLRLRHRGASHGLPFGLLMTAGVWFVLRLLSQTPLDLGSITIQVPADALRPWALAFGLGFLSHILGDACTHAGIRPFLPLSDWRFWLTPKFLRGKSNGPLDFIVRFIATTIILAGLIAYAFLR